ncbi:MAG: cation:dicarboxylase symporter family transporter [Eubacterium sp.]|nr:cation:dicarboxylase symporter family transporter [Eubacterium sp.]
MMKITPVKTKYKLEPQSVDLVSEDVQSFLTILKAPKKNIIATRLSIEEILLDLMDKYGEEQEFTYIKNNFLGKPYITITLEGEPFNPLEKENDDEFGNWSSALLQSANFTPSYSFDRGVNAVTFRFSKKEINPIIKLAITIAAALLVSLLKFVIPAESIEFIKDNLLDSFYNAFLGLMTTIEIPLVFLSVACGIIGIGDSTVFGKIGRKMVKRFITVILFFTTIAGIIFSMLFTNFTDKSSGEVSLKVGIDMLLDLIPKNLIEPITSGNTMQVVLMATFIGIAVVVLGSKAKTVSRLINESNSIIVYVTSLISKLMPVFIFIVLLDMMWSKKLHMFINMWKPIVAFVAVLVLITALMLITVSAKKNVKLSVLIKKMLPTFLISLGTASSIAANGECSDALYRRLGVNKRFVEFGQPVGGVIFMPSTAINFMVCALYMASYYKVNVSVLWFIVAIIICTFVAVATPPVPGGAIAAYTVIFAQLGIPSDALAIVVTMDIVFDLIATAFDSSFLQLELIRQADENKMLNFDVLRK